MASHQRISPNETETSGIRNWSRGRLLLSIIYIFVRTESIHRNVSLWESYRLHATLPKPYKYLLMAKTPLAADTVLYSLLAQVLIHLTAVQTFLQRLPDRVISP